MAPLLELQDLRTEFRLRSGTVVAVDGVSFAVDEGESVGIVGESGCGKSTTGLSVMRLLPDSASITGGAVTLLGRDLAGLDERGMQKVRGNEVALIPQDPMTSLNPTMSIGRQIAEGVRLHRGASKDEARRRALEVLRQVELPQPEERLDQFPHELSGGLRQRVMIAMALACEPKVLIADEPTTALDVTIQAQILDLLDDLRQRLSMALVLITHDMGVIAERTDRVVVMYAGTVVEEARTAELFSRIRHPYTEALLASVPRLDQERSERLLTIPGLPPDLSRAITGCRFAPRCRYATEQCRAEAPALEVGHDAGGAVHKVACFHPVDGESATAAPSPTVVATTAPGPAGSPPGRPAAEAAAPLLAVEHLTKEFPVLSGGIVRRRVGSLKAVTDVSLTVGRGQTYGLVGESGCGKTTVGRLVVGLEQADRGSVRFEGEDLTALGRHDLRARRRDLQLMFQDPYASLDPRMRVGTIVREPLKVHKIGTAAEQAARVGDLLDEVGLARDAADRYPHEFSGGQRQRIGLARALALDPKLIVADEPVSALDVSIQAQILNLMKDLQARLGLTYILISHDLAVVRYMADTIGVMYLGQLVETGPAAQIYDRPAHPYTVALLGAVPTTDGAGSGAHTRRTRISGELPSAVNPPAGCRFSTRCPGAQPVCFTDAPPVLEFGGGHRAACHFPLQTPVTLTASGSTAPA
jgi:oligopeptide/dipeptide ABC transporter ATP-binding protein